MFNRLFAIGDIHGCFKPFKHLIESTFRLSKQDKLVLVGDYIDRGTQSKEVVDYIIELQEKGYEIVPLLGNHEVMLLEAFENMANTNIWIQNGGLETLKSFNIKSIRELSNKYIQFFSNLGYYHSYKDILFVHAGFNDKAINPFHDTHSMVWECHKSYTNPLLINKTIIHGHRPITKDRYREQFVHKGQVINIDTGCVYNDRIGFGKLSGIELLSNTHF